MFDILLLFSAIVATRAFQPANRQQLQEAVNGWPQSEEQHGPISTWDTSQVTSMAQLFFQKDSFDGNISTWDVSQVRDMSYMFGYAAAFNGNLSAWDTSQVTDMSGMFQQATAFNGNISSWDTSQVTSMAKMFQSASHFNGDLSSWDTSQVTDMSQMFYLASAFNGNISSWDTSQVTDMSLMFYNAGRFNCNLSSWDTSQVTTMDQMFYGATAFNGNISSWDTSQVINMFDMFHGATAFNGNISSWDTSQVTSMTSMFHGDNSFRGDLSSWDTSQVENGQAMFDRPTPWNNFCRHIPNNCAFDVVNRCDVIVPGERWPDMSQVNSAFNSGCASLRIRSSGSHDFSASIRDMNLEGVSTLNLASTSVSGSLQNDPPSYLQSLNVSGTGVSSVTNAAWLNLTELDLRGSLCSVAMSIDFPLFSTYVWRDGMPSCLRSDGGDTGQFCEVCKPENYKPAPGVACKPCLGAPGYRLLMWVVLHLLICVLTLGIVVGICWVKGLIKDKFNEGKGKIRALVEKYKRHPRAAFMKVKTKSLILAYQKLFALSRLSQPLPAGSLKIIMYAQPFSLEWLSSTSIASCLLHLNFHWRYLLVISQNLLVIFIAYAVALFTRASPQGHMFTAWGFVVMSIATNSLMMFECDNRLQGTYLSALFVIPEASKKSFLKMDYTIECWDQEDTLFKILASIVFTIFCLLLPYYVLKTLSDKHEVLNPKPQHGSLIWPEGGEEASVEFRFPTHSMEVDKEVLKSAVVSSHTGPSEWAIIKRNQNLQKAPKELKNLASVYEPFVCPCWWFDIYLLYGRVGISVILTLPESWQSFSMTLLCFVFALSIAFFHPYVRMSDNVMEMVVFATLALVTMLQMSPMTGYMVHFCSGFVALLPGLAYVSFLIYSFRNNHVLEMERSRQVINDIKDEKEKGTSHSTNVKTACHQTGPAEPLLC